MTHPAAVVTAVILLGAGWAVPYYVPLPAYNLRKGGSFSAVLEGKACTAVLFIICTAVSSTYYQKSDVTAVTAEARILFLAFTLFSLSLPTPFHLLSAVATCQQCSSSSNSELSTIIGFYNICLWLLIL